MKKITKATIKSFIKKNFDRLYIDLQSRFDGMTDCCERRNEGMQPVIKTDQHIEHNFGIHGAWFVGQSRDYFRSYCENGFKGFEIYNSCGRFILAVKE